MSGDTVDILSEREETLAKLSHVEEHESLGSGEYGGLQSTGRKGNIGRRLSTGVMSE